jgi:hypothetical protein
VKSFSRPSEAAGQWAKLTALELEDEVLQSRIPADMTFRQFCEDLAAVRVDPESGKTRVKLKVDGKPFRLDDRPAMAWIYDQVPGTPEQMRGATMTVMKCAQVGFTVMEMLIAIYYALKFEPMKIGMFLPDMNLARGKSRLRFKPIARAVRKAYEPSTGTPLQRSSGEGNVMTQLIGESWIHFLWTSGRATTESYPMDVVSFDEVQEMLIADIEKAGERLSGSDFKFTLMGSTANWPDADIHHWYKKGTRHRFHTLCPTCGVKEPLDGYFPDCIGFDPTFPDRVTGVPGDYRYVCREGHWIDEPQTGEWIPENPEAALRKNISIHFHQMLSPTISPREMYEAFVNADDLKNFYNRKLGKPYQDPSQIPVTLEMLAACAAEGMRMGLEWKTRARGAYMGIDQMGAFNVAIIKERLPDGRQAVIHVEEIYSADPFARCDELMETYGVSICVVETLPNYNDAHRFATRFPGRVFLAQYGDMKDDALRWGDGPKLDVSERRTEEQERTRYTVTLDQYKCMSLSLARLVHANCLFPDPAALVQEVRDKGVKRLMALLKERVFLHFQRTALVTERANEGERKYRRKVVKVGIDPHFSYANMLCDVAFSRAHGTATFLIPEGNSAADDRRTVAEQKNLHGLPSAIAAMFEPLPPGEICGNCTQCPMGAHGAPEKFFCQPRYAEVRSGDAGCPSFVGTEGVLSRR